MNRGEGDFVIENEKRHYITDYTDAKKGFCGRIQYRRLYWIKYRNADYADNADFAEEYKYRNTDLPAVRQVTRIKKDFTDEIQKRRLHRFR